VVKLCIASNASKDAGAHLCLIRHEIYFQSKAQQLKSPTATQEQAKHCTQNCTMQTTKHNSH